MPLYERICEVCKHQKEGLERMGDTDATKCPECGGDMYRMMSMTQRPRCDYTPIHHKRHG